jgi:di/tricarboxylate transporter
VTRHEVATLAVLAGMTALFFWDRLRSDVVALLALLTAVLTGIVPAEHAFSGFAEPVLPLIAGALVVSAAIAKSGAVEVLVRWLTPLLRSPSMQVGVLVTCVAGLSAFMKNVGALAIFIPVGFQVARRNDRAPSEFLMPLSFASLLGGSITLIGTSPHMLAATVRQQLTGTPFHIFDFTPVAAGTAICGVLFLAFGWRLIPHGRRSAAADAAFKIEDYSSEIRISPESSLVGRTVAQIEEAAQGDVTVTAIVRDEYRRYVPGGSWAVLPEDLLVVEADPQALQQFIDENRLELVGSQELPEIEEGSEEPKREFALVPAEMDPNRLAVVEAVIAAGSQLIGHSAAELHLREHHGVNVLAIGRRGRRMTVRLRRVKFRLGDAILFQGRRAAINETIAALGCLPLAERGLRLGRGVSSRCRWSFWRWQWFWPPRGWPLRQSPLSRPLSRSRYSACSASTRSMRRSNGRF